MLDSFKDENQSRDYTRKTALPADLPGLEKQKGELAFAL